MATASIKTKGIERVVDIVNDGITLELSNAEARFLLAILDNIGGAGARDKYGTPVASALRGAGVRTVRLAGSWYPGANTSGIYLSNDSHLNFAKD
jgi:hypothetical protein